MMTMSWIKATTIATAMVAGILGTVGAGLIMTSQEATSSQGPVVKDDRMTTIQARLDLCETDAMAIYGEDCIEALIDQEIAEENVRYVTLGKTIAPATSELVRVPVAN